MCTLDELNSDQEIILCKGEIFSYEDTIYLHKKRGFSNEETKYVVSRYPGANAGDDFISASPAQTVIKSFKKLNSDTIIHVRISSSLVHDHRFLFDILPDGDEIVTDLLLHPNPESKIQKIIFTYDWFIIWIISIFRQPNIEYKIKNYFISRYILIYINSIDICSIKIQESDVNLGYAKKKVERR